MRNNIRAIDLANSIRMKRSHYALSTFALVEGVDDFTFYDRNTHCRCVIAHGRPNVLAGIAILNQDSFKGAIGIVDADFSVLEGEPSPAPNVIVSDAHDLELMLVSSAALEHVLRERGSPALVEGFEKARGNVREALIALAKPLGYLRWASLRHSWSLRFDGLDFTSFIGEKALTLDVEAMVATVRNLQGGAALPPPTETEMLQRMAELEGKGSHDPWHVCCGHDYVEILSIGLRRVLGGNGAAEVKPSRIERELRLAYERSYFQSTKAFVQMHEWEQANPPFRACCP